MRELLAIAALIPLCVSGATLLWEPAANDLSPATAFRVYQSIPGATFSFLSATTNKSLALGNPASGTRYYVTGTNQWGESLPSGTVTVPSPPQAPGSIVLQASLVTNGFLLVVQVGDTPAGPWRGQTNLVVPILAGTQFFRAKTP